MHSIIEKESLICCGIQKGQTYVCEESALFWEILEISVQGMEKFCAGRPFLWKEIHGYGIISPVDSRSCWEI